MLVKNYYFDFVSLQHINKKINLDQASQLPIFCLNWERINAIPLTIAINVKMIPTVCMVFTSINDISVLCSVVVYQNQFLLKLLYYSIRFEALLYFEFSDSSISLQGGTYTKCNQM